MMGRDASRSPRGGASDSKEVIALIVQREQARHGKDFASADQVRMTLSAMGVTLFDKTKSWSCSDGRSGRIPSFSDLESGHTAESLSVMQQQKDLSPGIRDATTAHIKDLVKQREVARAGKDFTTSDRLREELKALGVELYDKEKMWRSTSGQSGCIIGFGTAGGILDMEITTLVVQREKARQSGDWSTSDMIRDELKEYGVEIFDKEKLWKTTEGRQGAVPTYAAIQAGQGLQSAAPTVMGSPGSGRAQFGGGGGAAGFGGLALGAGGGNAQQQLIQAALQAASNPATAAKMLQALNGGGGGLGGGLGGGRAAPSARPAMGGGMGGMGGMGGGAAVPEARDAQLLIQQSTQQGVMPNDGQIEWLVGVREKVRQAKDFHAADELRNGMRTIGIELHEKEKRWSTSDGRVGLIPTFDQLGLRPGM